MVFRLRVPCTVMESKVTTGELKCQLKSDRVLLWELDGRKHVEGPPPLRIWGGGYPLRPTDPIFGRRATDIGVPQFHLVAIFWGQWINRFTGTRQSMTTEGQIQWPQLRSKMRGRQPGYRFPGHSRMELGFWIGQRQPLPRAE